MRQPITLRRIHPSPPFDADARLTEAFVRLVAAQQEGTIESFAVGPGPQFWLYFYGPDGGRAGSVVLGPQAVIDLTDPL